MAVKGDRRKKMREPMVSFIVRLNFDSREREEVSELLRALASASRQEPGCISYIPHFVEGELCTVLIYEQYADDAALEQHRHSAHFQQYAVAGLYQKMRSRQVEDLSAIN